MIGSQREGGSHQLLLSGCSQERHFIKGMLPLRLGSEEQVAVSFLLYLRGPGTSTMSKPQGTLFVCIEPRTLKQEFKCVEKQRMCCTL